MRGRVTSNEVRLIITDIDWASIFSNTIVSALHELSPLIPSIILCSRYYCCLNFTVKESKTKVKYAEEPIIHCHNSILCCLPNIM